MPRKEGEIHGAQFGEDLFDHLSARLFKAGLEGLHIVVATRKVRTCYGHIAVRCIPIIHLPIG